MKKIIFLVIIILILSGGFFWWWWEVREIKGSPEDYIIKETPEGKIIENQKAGLTVKAPEGWETQKIEFGEGSVAFDTQDVKGVWRNEMVNPPLEKGCIIETAIVYREMNFDEIKTEVKDIHAGLGIKSEEFEVITIKNAQALKNIFDSVALGPGLVIYLPIRDKLYNFSVNWAPNEEEKCIQEFNQFLETVSIE